MIEKFKPIFFNAQPIFKIENVYTPNLNEIKFLKFLSYHAGIEPQGFHLSESVNILDNKELENIKNHIVKAFDVYKDNILEIENTFYISQSWSTINKKNSMHTKHNHPNTLFSCVFYVDVDSSGINFFFDKSAIQQAFNFSYKIKKHNIHNSTSWSVPVNTGDMIIFPGDIQHSSFINESDKERIIVGANFFIKGEIGTKENVDRMII